MTKRSSEENSFARNREELEKLLPGLDAADSTRRRIESALAAPILSIAEEMHLYEDLEKGDDIAAAARRLLVQCYAPLSILRAWPFRNLGVPLVDLVDAAHDRLVAAAECFVFQRKPQYRSFYSSAYNVALEGVLDKLDQVGVEQIDIPELRRLVREGKHEVVREIMSPLDWLEKTTIEHRLGLAKIPMPKEMINSIEPLALRKLRRSSQRSDNFIRDSGCRKVQQDECDRLYRKELQGDEPIVVGRVENATAESDVNTGTFLASATTYSNCSCGRCPVIRNGRR